MEYNFFAMISRMKYIDRWALMRNSRQENLSEHSLEVSMIAHALAVIRNEKFGGRLDPGAVEIGRQPVCRNPRCITQTQPYLPPLVKRIGDVDCCAFCDAALS